MSGETKPVITSLTRSTWNSGKAYEFEPMLSSSISQASSIPELILYLKSAFRDKEFSLVEGILMDRDKQLREEKLNMENQLKDMQRENEELKNGKAEVEAKLKMYLGKFKELESRVSLQEVETAKTRTVDVSVIHKMAEDADVVEVNSKASGAAGDLQEKQLSPPRAPPVDSTGNGNGIGNGKSRDEGIIMLISS